MEKIKSSIYDKNCFYWAVTYKPNQRSKEHIVCLYPTHDSARRDAFQSNKRFKECGFSEKHFSTKRFMFRFKGKEIDAYEHEFKRKEKK